MDTQTEPKTRHAATISPRRAFPRKTGASNRHDFSVVFANGVEYEVTNCRNAGHARLLARIAEEQKGQRNGAIVRTEKLPFDPLRHKERGEFCGGKRGRRTPLQ